MVCLVNGPVSYYVVKLTDGQELKRHVDHLQSRLDREEIELSPIPVAQTEPSQEPINYDLIQTGGEFPELRWNEPIVTLRRSSRWKNRPDWYHNTIYFYF